MFEELQLATMTNDDGELFVSVSGLAFRLWMANNDIYEMATAKIESGEMSMEHSLYMQGVLDAFREVGKLLIEGGLSEEFNKEMEAEGI